MDKKYRKKLIHPEDKYELDEGDYITWGVFIIIGLMIALVISAL